jgi:hypothetical protein
MARNADYYVTAALAALNAGFTSKAAKKGAMADLNRAYERLREQARSVELSNAPHRGVSELTGEMWTERHAYFNAHEVPYDLHLVRPAHLAIFDKLTGNAAEVARLVELRAVMKAAEVTPPVKREPSKFEVRAVETLKDLLARRQAQYAEAVDLGEVFGRMPVTASTHWVTNEHGTTFLRTFYYLRGKLTPLHVLVAAAEELERRAEQEA